MVSVPVLQRNGALRVFTRKGEVRNEDQEEVATTRPSRSRQYDLNGNLKCDSLINLVLSKGGVRVLFTTVWITKKERGNEQMKERGTETQQGREENKKKKISVRAEQKWISSRPP